MRALALLAIVVVAVPLAAGAQTKNIDAALIGRWTSTMMVTDGEATPPLKFEETLTLTIAANGNLYLVRSRRAPKSKRPEIVAEGGVYTVPVIGILRMTFNPDTTGEAALWRYKLAGDKLTLVDDESNIGRVFTRIYDQ